LEGEMSQKFGRNEPMPDALTDDQIREWLKGAEKRETARTGANQPEARAAIARQLSVGYWTITNLLRRRLKGLRGDLRDKIKAGMIRHIESEIQGLSDELALVRQCGSTLSDAKIMQAEGALEQARAFLKGDDE
jgi:hypothetical protein